MNISPGIPKSDIPLAAALYWEAFGPKLKVPLGPKPRGLAFVIRVIDPSHAISAHAADGTLLGVAGFKTAQGALVGGSFDDLRAIYGLFGATWRSGLLRLLERDTENARFLMDGIFVTAGARGKGIGTALLDAITHEACHRGYTEVRLDVIDQNHRARALYEREGFTAIGTTNLGLLRHIFGFTAATTMVRKV